MIGLDASDRIVALTGSHQDAARTIQSVLVAGYVSSSRDALAKLLGALEPIAVEGEDPADVSATIITRTRMR